MKRKINFAFFGSSDFSVMVLENLKTREFIPSLIVTIEDKPRGRKMLLIEEEVKAWAEKEKIPYFQFKSIKSEETIKKIKKFFTEKPDVFIVANYGKLIPKEILEFPANGTLNIHPSLLPKLRGASPIKSAILEEDETGITIIKLDEEIDHGPILYQEKIETIEWPPYEQDLERICAIKGADLISKIFQKWTIEEIKAIEQDHTKATYCRKIEKQDAELNLSDKPEKNLRKIRAFHRWPGAYFFLKKNDKKTRIIVKSARIESGELVIEKIVPEGKKEMLYKDFLRGLK